jgi:hypothetical protein
MAMIKKINRKNAIKQISIKEAKNKWKKNCEFCGEEISQENIVDDVCVCPNPKCPSHKKGVL